MAFFGKKKREWVREEHITEYWDEVLYAAMFKKEEDSWQKENGHYMNCILTKRKSIFSSFSVKPEHIYSGFWEVAIDIVYGVYSPYIVKLVFEQPSGQLISRSGEAGRGYMHFGHESNLQKGRQLPSLTVILVDTDDLSGKISRFFVESKVMGNQGMEFTWLTNLTSIIGYSAEVVWGDWESHSYTDDNKFPGRQNFPILSYEFKVE